MSETDVLKLVARYRAGWFGHDVDAIMQVVSDDVVFHNVTAGERVEGTAAFREHVAGIHTPLAGPQLRGAWSLHRGVDRRGGVDRPRHGT